MSHQKEEFERDESYDGPTSNSEQEEEKEN